MNRLNSPVPPERFHFISFGGTTQDLDTIKTALLEGNSSAPNAVFIHRNLNAITVDMMQVSSGKIAQVLKAIPQAGDESYSSAPHFSLGAGSTGLGGGSGGGGPSGPPRKTVYVPLTDEMFNKLNDAATTFTWTANGNPLLSLPALPPFDPAAWTAAPTKSKVVILDTAPTEDELFLALEAYPHNTLLKSLMDNWNKKFFVHYPPLRQDANDRSDEYLPHMKSHGLFIAGLIHVLAPEAEIHLYRIMNDYGIANSFDLTILFNGAEKPEDPEVVVTGADVINFSLVTGHTFFVDAINPGPDGDGDQLIPDAATTIDPPDKVLKAWFKDAIDPDERMIETGTIRKIFRSLFEDSPLKGIPVIAPAGNANDPRSDKGKLYKAALVGTPRPAYPARLKGPISVGALKWNSLDLTEYSNEPNINDKDSEYLSAPGGEGQKTPPDHDLLGLYIGDYPKGLVADSSGEEPKIDQGSNTTGYAYWSGTSFATALVTGLVARWIGEQKKLPSPKSALDMITNLTVAQRNLGLVQKRP